MATKEQVSQGIYADMEKILKAFEFPDDYKDRKIAPWNGEPVGDKTILIGSFFTSAREIGGGMPAVLYNPTIQIDAYANTASDAEKLADYVQDCIFGNDANGKPNRKSSTFETLDYIRPSGFTRLTPVKDESMYRVIMRFGARTKT